MITDTIDTCAALTSGGSGLYVRAGNRAITILDGRLNASINALCQISGSFAAVRDALEGPAPRSYAGIGSRETPEPVLLEMQSIAMQLAMRGWMLRSGGADGADSAFEKGCGVVAGRKAIYRATNEPLAMQHASLYHPNWGACSDYARQLHARNSQIMLGPWLDQPVSFVVCWTPGGGICGGTGQALRIAAGSIPVFNLAVTPVAALWEWLG